MRPGDARAPWTTPVNLVLVGCGAVARTYYAPALTRLLASGWVGAVRLFDPTSARAREVAALLPAGAVAPSWEDVLNGPEELAIVASPPVGHAEQVRALLEHGKHVLCEKPFVLDRAASESLVDLARERGLLCAAGMVRRFSRSACLLRTAPFRGTPHPARVARGQPLSLAGRVSRVLRPRGWEPVALGHRLACRSTCLSGGSGSHTSSHAETTRWAGRRRTACSSSNGRTAAAQRCGSSRELRAPARARVERPAGGLSCRDVAEGDVLRGSEEAAAPDFEEWIPGAAAPAGRTFADCFELQLQTCSPPSAASRHSGPLPRTWSSRSERSRGRRREAGCSRRRG